MSEVTHLLKVVGHSNSVVSIAKAKVLSIKSLYSRVNHVLRTCYVQNPGASTMINVQT